MRPNVRRLVAPVTILLFAVILVTPLLQQRMTCSDDGAFGIHKALGLELALDLGHWFPRWSPHMAHGFGYPLYNFYAPLGSYLLTGLHKLGLIYPAALHSAFALSIALAGLAVYGLVKPWWGTRAGIAAGVVYLTSPYLAFNILFRGALAETLALVWVPLILWSIDRALRRREPRRMALAALFFAGLVYTHNTTALVASPLVIAYSLLLSWELKNVRVLVYAALILLGGTMLSAHFWIPALAEHRLVQTEQLLSPPIFTYYTNFLTPSELLALPTATITHLLNPSPPKALGAIAAGLAMAGTATIVRNRRRRETVGALGNLSTRNTRSSYTKSCVFFSVTMIMYSFLTLPYSRSLWDTLPLLPFVQFPWRMLGVATLCAAVLAGCAVSWFEESLKRAWIATAMITSLAVLGHLSWWYPRYCADFREATLDTMIQYEYETFTVGTSAKGEFLPRTVEMMPDNNMLAEALQRGETPNRIQGLPNDATINVLDSNPLDFHATVHTPEPFTATYQMFYYLGWRVSIDGKPQELQVTATNGLIQFKVPAGDHQLRVFFGTTPLRYFSSSLTILALLGLIVTLLYQKNRSSVNQIMSAYAPALMLVLPISLLGAKLLVIDRTNNLFHRTMPKIDSLGIPLHIQLDNGLDTLAYSVRPNPVVSGQTFEVLLYLTPRHTPERDFRPVFRLQSRDGQIWNLNPKETLPPRWHREPPRTQYWPIGNYGQFARLYTVLPGTPPGEYVLTATFFDYDTLETSKILEREGLPQADRIDLGKVHVIRPSTSASPIALDLQNKPEIPLTPEITLLGGGADRQHASPGDLLSVTLFFAAEVAPTSDEYITLRLEGTDFALALEPTPGFPTGQWQAGDVWRGQHLVRLPAGLEDGIYRWTVVSSANLKADVDILQIDSPNHVFDQPATNNSTNIRFGTEILLIGYEWPKEQVQPGAVVDIKLIWQAIQTPEVDLSAFVHLENHNGELVAQHDAVPSNWTRPSTGWVSGEYVTDSHLLTIPTLAASGEYRLYVGLADRTNGVRVTVTDASGHGVSDRALLGTVTVIP